MRRILSSVWFKVFLALAVIGALFAFNRINLSAFANLSRNWKWLVLAFALMMPPYAIVSYRFLLVLRNQGIAANLRQALRWTMIGSFFDVAMPSNSGGDVVKAAYVVRELGAGWRTKGVMAVAFDRVLGLLGLFLLAGVTTVLGWQTVRVIPDAGKLLTFVLTVSVGSLVFLRVVGARSVIGNPILRARLGHRPIGARVLGVVACFNSLRERPSDLYAVLGLSMLNHVFWCAALLCVTKAFEQPVDPVIGFTVFPLAIFSNVFGFAGGFGVGTAAFDVIFARLLDIHVGAAIGLTFQTLSGLSRLTGLPFYLAAHRTAHEHRAG